ncbi:MAG: TfoX/Sxy family protein [Planctomycetaceae bacterium]|nr:TfoX/Sxy family protein [Planctomycetales bacterium]MCB9927570.1 TfoX/Sxy family protein [Planctomycetaceae bacterium]
MASPFVKYLLDMLSDLGDVRSRAMFGGYGIYHEGVMIGLIASGVFYLKVDDENRAAFEAEGSKPFTYRRKGKTKAVAMSYWEVPVDVLENREDLYQWARDAHAAAVRSKSKNRKRK